MKLSEEFVADAEARLQEVDLRRSAVTTARVRRRVAVVAAPGAGDADDLAVDGPIDGGPVAAVDRRADREERLIGGDDTVDMSFLERALTAGTPVCRIVVELNGSTEFATGFMVSPSLMMTNHHVLPDRTTAERARAEFDLQIDGSEHSHAAVPFATRPDRLFATDAELDVTLVALDPASTLDGRQLSEFGYHRLIAQPHKIEPGNAITIIQHPRGEPRKIALRENRLLRFLDADRLLYSSDTASGSSGSPAFSDEFQIVALHRAGRAEQRDGGYLLRDGRVVASLDGIEESEVVWEANEGVRISAICRRIVERLDPSDPLVAELLAAMDGDDDVITRLRRRPLTEAVAATPRAVATPDAVTSPGGLVLDVPLRIHVSLGAPAPTPAPTATPARVAPDRSDGALVEKAVAPPVDTDYTNRRGYDPGFLGLKVAMPTLTAAGRTAAVTLDGAMHIDYEHFSVALHRTRRMAIFTASNVDWRPEVRSDLSRRELGGLGDGDTEMWVTDPRLPAAAQLPNVFYDRDRQSFDKGHLVRRDDVCWGASDAEIIRANADTFHVTNCSPQRKDFNRSAFDDRGWGDLENLVERGIGRGCVFAGPVFADDDPVFEGRDDVGRTKVQIPSRFWKVIVERDGAGSLTANAFLLEQDLSQVEMEELAVPKAWTSRRTTVAALDALLPLLTFPAAVRKAGS